MEDDRGGYRKMVKEDKAKYDKFRVKECESCKGTLIVTEILGDGEDEYAVDRSCPVCDPDEKIEQEAEDDVIHLLKEREEKKKHLYAKLLSHITREDRIKYEKELLDIL